MRKLTAVTRLIALVGAGAMMMSVAACGGSTGAGSNGKTTLKFAAFDGGYGVDMYKEVVKAYEKVNPNVTIELTT